MEVVWSAAALQWVNIFFGYPERKLVDLRYQPASARARRPRAGRPAAPSPRRRVPVAHRPRSRPALQRAMAARRRILPRGASSMAAPWFPGRRIVEVLPRRRLGPRPRPRFDRGSRGLGGTQKGHSSPLLPPLVGLRAGGDPARRSDVAGPAGPAEGEHGPRGRDGADDPHRRARARRLLALPAPRLRGAAISQSSGTRWTGAKSSE